MSKICTKCKIEKDESKFTKDKSKKDGLYSSCKECGRKYNTERGNKKRRERYNSDEEYREKKKAESNNYNHRNKEKVAKRKREYRENNKEEISRKNRKFSKKYRRKPVLWDSKLREHLEPYEEIRKNGDYMETKCSYCDSWFIPDNGKVKYKVNVIHGNSNKHDCKLYCSEECKSECPTFKKKLYPEGYKEASGNEVHAELRKMVMNRDNHICQRCGKHYSEMDCAIHCHHIYPLNEDPIESADMHNCVTLCKKCHTWIHRNIPGCTNNELKCSYEFS